MHIHKHICTHPSLYAQMDICMNLIALQRYPLNKSEQTTPNKLTPNEYTMQEKVILMDKLCYFFFLQEGNNATGSHTDGPRDYHAK